MSAPRSSAGVLLIKTGLVLTAVALAYGVLRINQLGQSAEGALVLFLTVPAAATLLYWIIGLLVPSLFATGRISFPLPVTLPTVYTMLVLLTVTLVTRQSNSLFEAPRLIRVIRLWDDPLGLANLALSQCLALTILAWVDARIPDPPPERPS